MFHGYRRTTMRRHLLIGLVAVAITATFAFSGCGGGGAKVSPGTNRVPLPPIDFTITLPPNSGIDASKVTHERLRLQEALDLGRLPSDLPTDFRMVEAFVIRPENTVLPAPARLRLVPEEDIPSGTQLFLFRVGVSRHCTPVDTSFVQDDGSVSFETRYFGYFIVAENNLIARPGETFLCFAFADVQQGPLPLTVNLSGVAFGGVEPLTYTWDFGDGSPGAAGLELQHTYYDVGDYTVTVFATDSSGLVSDNFSTVITVTSEFQPLQSVSAEFIIPTDTARPYERHFIPSVVGGVPPYTWSWSFSDGYTSAEQDPVHEFSQAGLYTGTVRVTDAALDAVSSDFVVDLRRINLEVTPVFGYSPMEPTFSITADGIDSGATVILDYGDGAREVVDLSADLIYLHRYSNPGTYTAFVEAWENFGGGLRYVYSADINIVCVSAPVPIIYSLFPPQTKVGEQVTVFGVDFGPLQDTGDTVSFAPGVEAQVGQWTDSAIKVTVPATAVDGDVVVARTEQGVTYTSAPAFFNVVEPGQPDQPPLITLLSPGRGPVGTKVTILGVNFGDVQLPGDNVSIGMLHMSILSWSNNAIEAEIPAYAVTDDVIVNHNGMVSNAKVFDVGNYLVGDPPQITSLSPSSSIRGVNISINGLNFGAYLPDSVVFIGAIPMPIDNWTPTTISVLVPQQAVDGEIRVFQNGSLSNPMMFKVIPSPPNIYGVEQL
jgi:hypothetical protein